MDKYVIKVTSYNSNGCNGCLANYLISVEKQDFTKAVEYAKRYGSKEEAEEDAAELKKLGYRSVNISIYEGPKKYEGQDFLRKKVKEEPEWEPYDWDAEEIAKEKRRR